MASLFGDTGIQQLNELQCLKLLVAYYYGTQGTPQIDPDGPGAATGLTDTQLRATPVPVSISQTAGENVVVEGANPSTTAVTATQATKTVAASGTPEVLAAATTRCESVLLEGKNARGTNNTGNVWIGWAATNDSQLLMISPGGQLVLTAPTGKKLDLNLIYVDVATNADGITYTAFN